MLNWLLEPLSYEFMRNAIAMGILVGILCPVVGSYLIVQRMALLGDVIAHAVLPGVAIAFFLNINVVLAAFISGLFSTFIISWIRIQSKVKPDAAMALIFSSFFALGIILITLLKTQVDLERLLFGDILGVTFADVEVTLAIAVFVLLLISVFYKPLLFYTFDAIGAKAMGLPVNLLHLGLMAAITITIVASLQTVGVLLVISLLVGPGITAYLFVKELHLMMIIGATLGAITTLMGVYASYYFNIPSGPTIVLVNFVFFGLAFSLSSAQVILANSATENPLNKVWQQIKRFVIGL